MSALAVALAQIQPVGPNESADERQEVLTDCECEFGVRRGCHEERYNPAASDQGRRLTIEWTAQL